MQGEADRIRSVHQWIAASGWVDGPTVNIPSAILDPAALNRLAVGR